MKKSRFFWGFVLVLMALCLIVGQYDVFGEISIWTILLTICGGAVLLDGLFDFSIEGVVIGAAILLFLWKEKIGLGQLSGWTIFLAAVLLAAGLKILLHPFKMKIDAWKMRREMRKYNRKIASGNRSGGGNASANGADYGNGGGQNGGFSSNQNFTENTQGYNGSYVKLKRNFGGGIEYIRSNDFQRADIDLNFSGLKVYFDDAVIQGPDATLHIDASFSGLELFIPSEWVIDDRLQHFAGGTEIKHRPQNIAPTKTLKLKGNVTFSGVTVYYF